MFVVGGRCAEAGSPACTHLVVDEHNVKQVDFEPHHKLHIVKSEVSITWSQKEILLSKYIIMFIIPVLGLSDKNSFIFQWFWASIQMDACADESMYRVSGVSGELFPIFGTIMNKIMFVLNQFRKLKTSNVNTILNVC